MVGNRAQMAIGEHESNVKLKETIQVHKQIKITRYMHMAAHDEY